MVRATSNRDAHHNTFKNMKTILPYFLYAVASAGMMIMVGCSSEPQTSSTTTTTEESVQPAATTTTQTTVQQ